jgi:hypothetical protein
MMPPAINWHGPDRLGAVSTTRKVENNKITITQKVNLHPAIIQPENYPAILEINRRLKHPANRTIMIELGD